MALPPELQGYVDVLNRTESQAAFREAAFGIWQQEGLVREHIEKLGDELIVAVMSDKDAVAQLWICAQLCRFGLRRGLAPYAIMLAQGLNRIMVGEQRRTLQYALLDGLMSAQTKLPPTVARELVDAVYGELGIDNPYGWFVEHCIFLLGAIGDRDTRDSLTALRDRYPAAVAAALDGYGKATVQEIAAKVYPEEGGRAVGRAATAVSTSSAERPGATSTAVVPASAAPPQDDEQCCRKDRKRLTQCPRCKGQKSVRGAWQGQVTERPCPLCNATGRVCPDHGAQWY
jgi:hypothetical protein